MNDLFELGFQGRISTTEPIIYKGRELFFRIENVPWRTPTIYTLEVFECQSRIFYKEFKSLDELSSDPQFNGPFKKIIRKHKLVKLPRQ